MFLPAKRCCGYVKQHNETRGLDYRADVRRPECFPSFDGQRGEQKRK
jgi:hypothetical protein